MLLPLAVLTLAHQATAVVDCRLACRRCREKVDPPEMVEVYCAMCNECKERRVERMQTADATTSATTVTEDCEDVPEVPDCPEPPSCEETEPTKLPLKKKVTTTTTTTTTTTKRPCPKRRPPPCFCMPWQPVAMCPCPVLPSTQAWQLEPPKKLISPTDYMYVYVGVPKNLLDVEVEELS